MHGGPMGQRYGFGLQWKEKVRMSYVAPDLLEASPVDALSRADANAGYVVGPPYIATARDMYKICNLWCQFAPRVHGTFFVFIFVSPKEIIPQSVAKLVDFIRFLYCFVRHSVSDNTICLSPLFENVSKYSTADEYPVSFCSPIPEII